jgi:hypothetical protein
MNFRSKIYLRIVPEQPISHLQGVEMELRQVFDGGLPAKHTAKGANHFQLMSHRRYQNADIFTSKIFATLAYK